MAPFYDDLTLLPTPVPVSTSAPTSGVMLGCGVAVALVLLGVWVWRRRDRGVSSAPVGRSESARSEAERALQPWLVLADTVDEEERRRGAVAVSAVVRRFVEARLGLPASRLTLEELRGSLLDRREWPESFDAFWPGFMAECERVNYAGGRCDAAGIRRMAEQVLGFVRANSGEDAR